MGGGGGKEWNDAQERKWWAGVERWQQPQHVLLSHPRPEAQLSPKAETSGTPALSIPCPRSNLHHSELRIDPTSSLALDSRHPSTHSHTHTHARTHAHIHTLT